MPKLKRADSDVYAINLSIKEMPHKCATQQCWEEIKCVDTKINEVKKKPATLSASFIIKNALALTLYSCGRKISPLNLCKKINAILFLKPLLYAQRTS
jgi:hypothetical protein